MRYAPVLVALAAGVLVAAPVSSARADREDRARPYDYSVEYDREQARDSYASEKKWRRVQDQKKRHRGSYRYSYPWGPWGPFAGPPGL